MLSYVRPFLSTHQKFRVFDFGSCLGGGRYKWRGRLRISLKKNIGGYLRIELSILRMFSLQKNNSWSVKKLFQVQNAKLFWNQNFFKIFQNFFFIAFLAFSGDRDLFKSVRFFGKFEKLTEIWPFPWRVQDLLLYPFWPPFWGPFWPVQEKPGLIFFEKRS